jgi:P27 family predicted phage terminase small subunit
MPARTPTVLKMIKGTLRTDRAPVNEPSPAVGIGNAPGYLNEHQVELWNQLRDASPPGLLTAVDRGIFEGYVVLYAARVTAIREWNRGRNSIIVKSRDHARDVVNPYLKEVRRLTEQMRLIEGELGYTPSARSRIDLGNVLPAEARLNKYLA